MVTHWHKHQRDVEFRKGIHAYMRNIPLVGCQIYCTGTMHDALLELKLPSLFFTWLFWIVHTKSHNMKALVILSHSWSLVLPLTCLYGKINFCGSMCRLLEYFLEKKTSPRLPMQITWPWPPVGSFSHGLITVR